MKGMLYLIAGKNFLSTTEPFFSCCIDYVAAAHINADAIIHFGPICFSKMTDKIPFLNIYEKHSLALADLRVAVSNFLSKVVKDDSVVLLLDDGFIHLYCEFLLLGLYRVSQR